MSTKRPIDIDEVFRRIRAAVKGYPKAAMFELAEEGYDSLFEQLIACMISIRTYDEVSVVVARRLFERARTPEHIARLTVEQIDRLIAASTFHEAKAEQIRDIAQQVLDNYNGELPCDFDVLTGFHGVGPKCANLSLGIACRQSRISGDIRMRRAIDRWAASLRSQ